MDGLGFKSQHRPEIFLCPKTSRQALGPIQSPVQWILEELFPQEIKQPECEADHKRMSSTKVINDWSCA